MTLEQLNKWHDRQDTKILREREKRIRFARMEMYTRAELEAAERVWAKGEGQ